MYYCFVIVIIIINKYRCIPFFVGETADTLNALRYCKDRGALIVGVTNTGTLILQLKKPSPLQVFYEPSKAYGACACLDLERNALFTLLGHEAPACGYASYPCCLCHYSLSQSPQARPTGLYCVIRIAQSAHPFFMQCILRFNL